MNTSNSTFTVIFTVVAVVTMTALSVGIARKAERYQAAALSTAQTVPAAFDPGYRTFLNELYAGMGR